jgi:nucleoside-diphosphate-sugar epimerase
MSHVAITGCASRFAQALLPALEADALIERIVGIDLVAPVGPYAKLEFHQQDIRSPSVKETLTGCDTLVHLAFVVGRPYDMPLEEAASINLGGTWNACRAAAEAGVRKVVVSSSIAAYGILADNPNPLVEESPLRGLYNAFYYSQHKHANEIWLDVLQRDYPDLLISRLRPCIVMGPHQFAASTLLLQGDTYLTTDRGAEIPTQYVHEDDLAAAFHLMLERDLPGAYNVVGDAPDTIAHMAEPVGVQAVILPYEQMLETATLAWKERLSSFGPEWLGADVPILCSNAKLKAAGWTPRYSSGEAFAATIAALRAPPAPRQA